LAVRFRQTNAVGWQAVAITGVNYGNRVDVVVRRRQVTTTTNCLTRYDHHIADVLSFVRPFRQRLSSLQDDDNDDDDCDENDEQNEADHQTEADAVT